MVSETERPQATIAETIAGAFGVALYAIVGVFYLGSGLVVPAPWYVVIWALWIVGLYPLYLMFRSRRVWTFLVALVAAALWYGIIGAGEYLFDWTA